MILIHLKAKYRFDFPVAISRKAYIEKKGCYLI